VGSNSGSGFESSSIGEPAAMAAGGTGAAGSQTPSAKVSVVRKINAKSRMIIIPLMAFAGAVQQVEIDLAAKREPG
jgi:hypothetical protein